MFLTSQFFHETIIFLLTNVPNECRTQLLWNGHLYFTTKTEKKKNTSTI